MTFPTEVTNHQASASQIERGGGRPGSKLGVHLAFKTHFDYGFTDLAKQVLDRFVHEHFPRAMALAKRSREDPAIPRFTWTVGAWLVHHYLEQADAADRRRMEQAIEQGDILWHALPFTLHVEAMDAELFRFGLRIGRRLDERFGKTTVAGKMTDVPGHTRAMVPLLAEAGIRFLHLGVNPASPMPDVPELFLWRDEDSGTVRAKRLVEGDIEEVETVEAPLPAFIVTDPEFEPAYRKAEQAHGGEVSSEDAMNVFGRIVWQQRDELPVITAELGDTWIHGVGTDPEKLARFRALQWLHAGVAQHVG